MNLTLELNEAAPLAPQLFEAIRRAIVQMDLRPGQALSEKELSVHFNVSRQPVREAIIKLSEIGLLEIRPSRGTFVKRISVREVADARLLREAIECVLVSKACRMASAGDVANLRAIISHQEEAHANGDHGAFTLKDLEFHFAIGQSVQCDLAQKTLENARNQIDRVRFLSLDETTPVARLIAQHISIVDAIERGDRDAAQARMRQHLREILGALPKMAKLHPTLFDRSTLPGHTSYDEIEAD